MSQCADKHGGVCGRVSAHGGTHDQRYEELSKYDQAHGGMRQHDQKYEELSRYDQAHVSRDGNNVD